MRSLWRILIVIPVAFIAASIAASTFLVFAAGLHPQPGESAGGFVAELVFLGLIGSMFVGAVTFVPALILIALAEAFGWRSLILHLLIGAGIGFAAFLSGTGGAEHAHPHPAVGGAAGAVAGFVYWLIAGHGAGTEKRRVAQPPPGRAP